MLKEAGENQPKIGSAKFNCPHCGVLAKQDWTNVSQLSGIVNSLLEDLYLVYREKINSLTQPHVRAFCGYLTQTLPIELPRDFIPVYLNFAKCQSCLDSTVWIESEMIYPRSIPFPDPNEDLDDGIKKLYREAANVYQDSPRASAALLRLCLEELCKQLGEKGNLNACIGNLVARGLDEQIQQALDYCRVIGNNAVHAGQIDVEDDPAIIPTLFHLINDITYELITKPRELKERYNNLSPGIRKAIDDRDKKS